MNIYLSPGTIRYVWMLAMKSKGLQQTKWLMLRYRVSYR